MAPHKMFKHMMTLVLDFDNTFLAKIEIKNSDHLNELMKRKNFAADYILVENKKFKCKCIGDKTQCVCNKVLYLIRPYALEFFRSL